MGKASRSRSIHWRRIITLKKSVKQIKAKTKIDQSGGTVFVHGEYWNAVSEKIIKKDAQVRVISVKEMILKVEAVES